MSFTDIPFYPFIILIIPIYFLCPGKHQWKLLLLISALFYATWGIENFPFIIGAAFVAWLCGRQITKTYKSFAPSIQKEQTTSEARIINENAKKQCRLYLTIGVGILLSVLIFVKAFSLYGEALLGNIPIIVPLGISYYTFSLVGYIADCYWRKDEAETNFFRFALFTLYFPKILQGPIARHKDLNNQLVSAHAFSYDRMCRGIWLMMWGYFKKLVIADRLAIFVNSAFGDYSSVSGGQLFVAALMGSVQLYCDFSGCMDIACGFSEILGIQMEKNFDHPFFSETPSEFWRRWHITLGTWFRDYVYMPISISPRLIRIAGFFRKKFGRNVAKSITVIIPLSIVWILTGLWHSTGANYLVWGIYWGLLITIETLFKADFQKLAEKTHINTKTKKYHTFCRARTFLLFSIARILTIPGDLSVSGIVFKRILFNFNLLGLLRHGHLFNLGLDKLNLLVALAGVILLYIVSRFEESTDIRDWLSKRNIILRWCILYGLLFSILILGVYGPDYDASSFVYINF